MVLAFEQGGVASVVVVFEVVFRGESQAWSWCSREGVAGVLTVFEAVFKQGRTAVAER